MIRKPKIFRTSYGASVVEYAITIFLISGLVIGLVSLIGDKTNDTFENVSSELGNPTASTPVSEDTGTPNGELEITPVVIEPETFPDNTPEGPFQSCDHAYYMGFHDSGYYTIMDHWDRPYPAPCHMVPSGPMEGGWTPVFWSTLNADIDSMAGNLSVTGTINTRQGQVTVDPVTIEDYKKPFAFSNRMIPYHSDVAFGSSFDIEKEAAFYDGALNMEYNVGEMGIDWDHMNPTGSHIEGQSIRDPSITIAFERQNDYCNFDDDPFKDHYWCSGTEILGDEYSNYAMAFSRQNRTAISSQSTWAFHTHVYNDFDNWIFTYRADHARLGIVEYTSANGAWDTAKNWAIWVR